MSQPIELKQNLLEKCNGRCAYCGTKLSLSTVMVNHKDPLLDKVDDEFFAMNRIRKGEKSFDNLYPACKPCTASKRNMTIEEWRNVLQSMLDYLLSNSSQFKTMVRFCKIRMNEGPIEFYFEKMKQKTLES